MDRFQLREVEVYEYYVRVEKWSIMYDWYDDDDDDVSVGKVTVSNTSDVATGSMFTLVNPINYANMA